MDRLDWAALILAIAIVVFQLFIPPVIGLADDGDFGEVIGRFNLYPPQGQANAYVDTTYNIEANHHWEGDRVSSEIIFAAIAVRLNRIFSAGAFDLRWIGLVHAAPYILAFYLVLPLLRSLANPTRIIALAIVILVFADTMFTAALNSFYMDTAAWIFLCLATVLYLRARRWQTTPDRIGLLIALALLLSAKTQHIIAGLILGALILATARDLTFNRAWIAATIAATALGLFVTYKATSAQYAAIQPFNIIFYGLLPHSNDPLGDLQELGLDGSYKQFIGKHTYSEGSPMGDPAFVGNFSKRTGFGRIALFYARHPAQSWRLLHEALDEAGRERPYLGNYDRRTAKQEFQESNAFALWSTLKREIFYHRGTLYLTYVLTLLALICTFNRGIPAMAFAAITILEMLVCSIGDVLDTLRHEFIFNGLADLALVLAITLLAAHLLNSGHEYHRAPQSHNGR